MKNYYIDTHCHTLSDFKGSEPIETLIEQAYKNGTEKVLLLSTDLEDVVEVMEVAKHYHYVYLGIGIHPLNIKSPEDGIKLHQFMNPNVKAIGEVGLDYHYDNSPSKEVQKKVLKDQLDLAHDYNLGVSLHARDAYDDVFELLSKDKYKALNISLHSFGGNIEQTKKFLTLPNIFFGFSGILTFKNAKENQEVCKLIPLERILTETDTPYLTPHPHRGKPNNPSMIHFITKKIAELKGVTEEEVMRQVIKNTKKVFEI